MSTPVTAKRLVSVERNADLVMEQGKTVIQTEEVFQSWPVSSIADSVVRYYHASQ